MRASFVSILGSMAVATAVHADELTIGTFNDPLTLDPHIQFITYSNQQFQHIYDVLIFRNHNLELEPALAESWKPIDDKTWEIKLRAGVKWHDGTPFTADDVLFTVERSPSPPGVVASSGRFLAQNGKQWKKIDDLTLQVTTPKSYPVMPRDLSITHIISKKHAQGKTSTDFDSGLAAVGTGAYKLVEYVRGDRVAYQANPGWWGGKPKWDRVTFKFINSNPTRVASVLSGAVDLIDNVPPEDIEDLRKNPKVTVHTATTNRLIYLWPDTNRDFTPKITDNDGKPIRNPIRDWRVRKAISKAINREAIVQRVMAGVATVGSQYKAAGHSGHNPDIKVEPFDPEGAKKLLAEAGYPNGFKLTLNAAAQPGINALKVAEAVAQMLNRIGITTEVEVIPNQSYFAQIRAGAFSLPITSWISSNGESGDPLVQAMHSYWPSDQLGTVNQFRYSNRRADDVIDAFIYEMDPQKRLKLIHDAYAIVTDDLAYIPIHWEMGLYASRPDLNYVVRRDQYTLAENATKKK